MRPRCGRTLNPTRTLSQSLTHKHTCYTAHAVSTVRSRSFAVAALARAHRTAVHECPHRDRTCSHGLPPPSPPRAPCTRRRLSTCWRRTRPTARPRALASRWARRRPPATPPRRSSCIGASTVTFMGPARRPPGFQRCAGAVLWRYTPPPPTRLPKPPAYHHKPPARDCGCLHTGTRALTLPPSQTLHTAAAQGHTHGACAAQPMAPARPPPPPSPHTLHPPRPVPAASRHAHFGNAVQPRCPAANRRL